jgi:hypothetical protein
MLLYTFIHNLLNVLVQIANKMGLEVTASSDRFCGLVVRVPDYRSRGPGPIPGASTFSE